MAYETRRFNAAFTCRINPIHRIDIYLISISLFSHLRLDLPKGLFPIGLPVKIMKALLSSYTLATRPDYFNLLDLITLIILGERYKL